MKTDLYETKAVSILCWGSLIVTLVVTDRISVEPANLGKQLVLVAFAFALIPFMFDKKDLQQGRLTLLNLGLILLIGSMLVSAILSRNTFERGLYGSYGRNTGFLSYLALAIFFYIAVQLKNQTSYSKIVKFFLVAGFINIAYSVLAATGIDIFTWENPYGAVLGTFGNPNFIGAFMGISATVAFVHFLDNIKSLGKAFFYLLSMGFSFFVIALSNALQGILVAAFGIALASFFFLRSIEKFRKISYFYFFTLVLGAFVALLGILQRGPLSAYLYKPSVTFRGEYWRTGINMWMDNPIFGVGIDSYGQFYRTYRSLSATVYPGMNVTTDAAHNVYIDFLAGTGIIGFSAYALVNVLVLLAALRFMKGTRTFDPIFYSLFLGWITYQVQSIVSINQLGIAIWGWVLGGAVIGYASNQKIEFIKQSKSLGKMKSGTKQAGQLLEPTIFLKVITFFLAGFLLALPPFLNDSKMRNILTKQGTPEDLIKLAKNWPHDSNRMSRAYVILAQNERVLEAKELAAFSTTLFPNDYSSWYALYQIAPIGTPEREAYKQKLNQIDPLNPEYLKK